MLKDSSLLDLDFCLCICISFVFLSYKMGMTVGNEIITQIKYAFIFKLSNF